MKLHKIKPRIIRRLITCLLFNFPRARLASELPGFSYVISHFLKPPMVSFLLNIRIVYFLLKFTLKGCNVFSLPDAMTATFALPTLIPHSLLLLCFPTQDFIWRARTHELRAISSRSGSDGRSQNLHYVAIDTTVWWQPKRRVWHNCSSARKFSHLVVTPIWSRKRD